MDTEVDSDEFAASGDEFVRSELLCFLQNKSSLIPHYQLVNICADFYTKEEAATARQLIERYLPSGTRMSKRQGDNFMKNTVEDLLKVVLNPLHKLPTFCAVCVGRLPPVDVKNCAVSAILSELQALRSEVRQASSLKDEVAALKVEVAEVRLAVADVHQSASNVFIDPGDAGTESDSKSATVQPSAHNTFAKKAKELQITGMTDRPKKSVRKTVIGVSEVNKHVAAVKTFRNVDIFVSRCHPHTTTAEIANCVKDMKDNVVVHDIVCEQLKSRYEHLYSSFHVQVRVDTLSFFKAIDQFMSADAWPSDLLVRRYFPIKNDAAE